MVHTHNPPPGNNHDTTTKAALNAMHNCGTTTLRRVEDLARKHLHATTHTYLTAATCAHAMKHLRDLQSMYDNALRAKRDYHKLVDARLRDEISLMRIH